jgi:hypothetical protein
MGATQAKKKAANKAKSNKKGTEETRSTIDPTDVTLDNVRGTVVELSPREVFFRLESGSFGINRMNGEVAKTVPKDLNDFDSMCVVRGIRAGRLFIGTKEVFQDPVVVDQTASLSEGHITARRLLDIVDHGEFESAISKNYSIRVLELCLEIEKREGNRTKFISIINNRLSRTG